MLNTSVAPWPQIAQDEIDAVAAVLASGQINYWTGDMGRLFESEFAAWVGTRHAIAVSNGTLALELALKGLGIGPGDEVVVTPRSFVASASCVVGAGARPVFADVDADSGNITPETIDRVLSKRTKAIIPVHLAGWPCDMTGIVALAQSRALSVIEDCAQAHGARHGGRSVGGWGDVAAWSFCQDKIMSTGGEGGLVTVDDDTLRNRMWSYKDHGKSWKAVYETQHPPGFRWVHDSIGTNWRMLEVQAAIGRVQLGKLETWHALRTRNAHALARMAADYPCVRVPLPDDRDVHAFYRLYIYVDPQGIAAGWTRDRIIAELVARGTPAYQGSCPEIYRERAFSEATLAPHRPLPKARELGETSIMLLTHPTLTDTDLLGMQTALADVLSAATR